MWTVRVNKDGKVFLETEQNRDVLLYVEGKFETEQEHWRYASDLARKLNGTS
jgi:hypothetical protein